MFFFPGDLVVIFLCFSLLSPLLIRDLLLFVRAADKLFLTQ